MKRLMEKEEKTEEAAKYNFFPPSYLLPGEYAIFLEEWKRHPPGTFWIMKPVKRFIVTLLIYKRLEKHKEKESFCSIN
jgi:hypothetical protein